MTWRERTYNSWLTQRNAILKYMKKSYYKCDKSKIIKELYDVFHEQRDDRETIKFKERKNLFHRIKMVLFFCLRSVGFRHYDTMWILGYKSFLISEDLARKIIWEDWQNKKLLDIGAGDGSITEKFSPYIGTIECSELAISFQKALKKKWFKLVQSFGENNYDFVSLFNVLDRCTHPERLINEALLSMRKDGKIIMSLPFPISLQSWWQSGIKKTNSLEQSQEDSFEKCVSVFYQNFLLRYNLKVVFFTRLPYIVALPEEKRTTVYDSGLFVCEKI